MTDSDDQFYQSGEFRKKALSLTEEFASMEGRRPRILIGRDGVSECESVHKICNAFANMGFDVDIAPKQSSFKFLGTQSLENDSDMILICSDSCISSQKVTDLENNVFPFQPEMILSLVTKDEDCQETFKGKSMEWTVFNDKTSEYEMGYKLLEFLMSDA